MSLFPIEPVQAPSPRPPARPAPSRSTHKRLAIGAAMVAIVLGGGMTWRTLTGKPTMPAASAPTASNTFTTRELAAASCIDASGSVVKADDAPTRALLALGKGLTNWPVVHGPVKMTAASAAQYPLQLVVRLVEKNSYLTEAATSLVEVTIPAYPGVTGRLPSTDADDYAVRFATYKAHVTEAERARQDQEAAAHAAADQLSDLSHRRSTGSDVLGCVAAVAESAHPQDILIVSDLADTRLTEDDGTPRKFPTSLQSTNITIVHVCPSGSPQRCSAAATTFATGLRNMGLPDGNLNIVRAERTEDQVHSWISDLHAQSLHALR